MSQFFDPEEIRLDPALAGLTAGTRVGGGRFTLLRLLGRGGMGVVWLARDEDLRESVALKFLSPEIRHDAAALDDLRRETSRSRKLTHPHIVRIHDLYKGEQEAFVSMEYVDGPNLSELRLQQPDRVLKWNFLEPLIRDLCEALDYAHAENIVHRDLKPANLMLDSRGRLKLADFGIAAAATDAFSRISTARHALSGTASYVSPQQLDGQPPEITDDIYSIGATLYELLASRAPFFAGDIAHQVRSLPPQPLDKRLEQLKLHNPVPAPVSAMIMTCLSKEPEKRPQSARAIAEQIGLLPLIVANKNGARAKSQPERSAPRPEPAPTSSAEPAPVASSVTEDTAKSLPKSNTRSHRIFALVLVACVALIVISVGAWWFSRHYSAAKTPQSADPPVSEFASLFNGINLSGWNGDQEIWSVKDGAITASKGTSKDRRPVAIFWRGEVEDFELRLSFRIRSGNSGIYYRAKQLDDYEVGGYQFEITGNATGMLLETGSDRTRRQPSLPGFVTTARLIKGKDKVTAEKPFEFRNALVPGGWNDVVILVQSNHIVHTLNDQMVIDTTDLYEKRPRTGTIAFEVYGTAPTTVQFRDIRLKRLTPPTAQKN